MKNIISMLMMLSFTFALSACNSDQIAIEDYEWKMRTVMRSDIDVAQNEDELVVAVGEEDELYPYAKIADVTLIAKDGKITVTDTTNIKTFSGSYTGIEETPDGMCYEIVIDGITGYATVSPTEYYENEEIPTLPINIGDYCVYFIPKN